LLLGDRVVVMGAAPGRVVEVLDVPFERPRTLELTTEPAFNAMKARILQLLHPEVYAP
jgi:NitT/TauT family transport system ATP-binding protein